MAKKEQDLTGVFTALRAILQRYEAHLQIDQSTATFYTLNSTRQDEKGKPYFFGGVRLGKNYVGYYLLCAYREPKLFQDISEEMRRRKQGKSCFNFRAVDDTLFQELSRLTERSFQWMQERNMV